MSLLPKDLLEDLEQEPDPKGKAYEAMKAEAEISAGRLILSATTTAMQFSRGIASTITSGFYMTSSAFSWGVDRWGP